MQRKRKLREELRSSWFIPLRLSIFLLLFGAAILFGANQDQLLQPFLMYSLATLLFLLVIEVDTRLIKSWLLQAVIFTHIVFELLAEGAIVRSAGHLTSQYSMLFLLTIVSASLIYRLAGTLSVATLASLIYAFTSVTGGFFGQNGLDLLGLRQTFLVNDDVFYAVFLHICTFYLVAFISGFLAEKLRVKEGELSHTSERLERVQLDTDDILLNLHSGLLTIDSRGIIIYFNRAAESILGMRQADVRGRSLLEVFNPTMPQFCERILSVLKLSKPNYRTELEIPGEGGKRLPLGLTASVLGDEQSGIRGIIAIFQDLTQAKQMEAALLEADRLAAVGELSARIAHEIRNPLASISGSVEVLKNEIQVTGENARLMELIVKESERLSRVLSDFLAYARTGPVRSTKVELVSVAGDTVELLRHDPNLPRGVKLEFRSNPSTVYVIAEEDQVRQVLINLITNAIQAVDPDHGSIMVELAAPESNQGVFATEWISLRVVDNGCGFTPEDRSRVFEPFFSRKKGGTGLGLAIVKRCLDNIGARITVDSIPGKGTTFSILFKKYLINRDADRAITASLQNQTQQIGA
jgi:two-component system sensor histidine kinase PilS (NtrC family)